MPFITPSSFSPPSDKKPMLYWLALGALGLAWVSVLVYTLLPVLAACVLAGAGAYLVWPIFRSLVRRRWPRGLAAFLVALGLWLALLGAVALLVPLFYSQWAWINSHWPQAVARAQEKISGLWALFPGLPASLAQLGLDTSHWESNALEYLNSNRDSLLAWFLSSLKAGGSLLLAALGYAVLAPVLMFYLLKDGRQGAKWLLSWLPSTGQERVVRFTQAANQVVGEYLRGQLWVVLCLVLYYSVTLGLLGLDAALFVGLFTGVGVILPYLGFGLGLLLALVFALLQWPVWHALLVVGVVYGIGQFLESFVLTPWLVGGRIGVHPALVILALLLLGYWLGFVGVLLALPITGLLALALRWAHRALKKSTGPLLYRPNTY
jgi:predicted PurR-regulated permease PerM